jgi:hypothetical protein
VAPRGEGSTGQIRDMPGRETGVLPRRTTCFGPRTEAAGFIGTICPVTYSAVADDRSRVGEGLQCGAPCVPTGSGPAATGRAHSAACCFLEGTPAAPEGEDVINRDPRIDPQPGDEAAFFFAEVLGSGL